MGIRKGLFLGLLAGSAIASALTKKRRAEAPAEGALPQPASDAVHAVGETAGPMAANPLKDTLDLVKRRAEEAIDAAHEAQEQTEAELRRQFDEARRKQS